MKNVGFLILFMLILLFSCRNRQIEPASKSMQQNGAEITEDKDTEDPGYVVIEERKIQEIRIKDSMLLYLLDSLLTHTPLCKGRLWHIMYKERNAKWRMTISQSDSCLIDSDTIWTTYFANIGVKSIFISILTHSDLNKFFDLDSGGKKITLPKCKYVYSFDDSGGMWIFKNDSLYLIREPSCLDKDKIGE